jgi:hypothetical protein
MTIQTSYIDTADLVEVLTDYFDGSLNDCDKYLSRLYKGLSNLHPSNSLHGQLCENELTQCLWGLPTLERAVLDYKFRKSDRAKIILTHHFFNSDEGYSDFDNFCELLYLEALHLLSLEILAIL